MQEIKISEEVGKTMEDVRKRLSKCYSKSEVDKSLALTLNEEARNVLSRQRKKVREVYTINNKYMHRASIIKHRASTSHLEADLGYNVGTIPMIAFNHKDLNPKSTKYFAYSTKTNGVEVEIKKGEKRILRHAFIKKVKAGNSNTHEGIWEHGVYENGKFIRQQIKTSRGKDRITQMMSASPFTMNTSKEMQQDANEYISQTMPQKFVAITEQKMKKEGVGSK